MSQSSTPTSILCIHTADTNRRPFDDAASDLSRTYPLVRLTHWTNAEWPARAEASGGQTRDLVREVADELSIRAAGHDAVILTCTTLGAAADLAASKSGGVPILRSDRALVRKAAERVRDPLFLCTSATGAAATEALIRSEYADRRLAVRLIPGAWDLFKAGRTQDYCALIADVGDRALGAGFDCIALTQTSMAPASVLSRKPDQYLTAPAAALEAALSALM